MWKVIVIVTCLAMAAVTVEVEAKVPEVSSRIDFNKTAENPLAETVEGRKGGLGHLGYGHLPFHFLCKSYSLVFELSESKQLATHLHISQGAFTECTP